MRGNDNTTYNWFEWLLGKCGVDKQEIMVKRCF